MGFQIISDLNICRFIHLRNIFVVETVRYVYKTEILENYETHNVKQSIVHSAWRWGFFN
jgi:hypothetical protein